MKEYYEMNARPLINKIKNKELKDKELKKLLEYEKKNKNRKTVIKAIKEEISGLEKYYRMNARPLIKEVNKGELSKKELKKLLEHEKKNKNRKTVIEAIKEEMPEKKEEIKSLSIKMLKPEPLKEKARKIKKENKLFLGISKPISEQTGIDIMVVRLFLMLLILSVVGIPIFILLMVLFSPKKKKKKGFF